MSNFKTKPIETESIPSGIPYIIGNEVAERFSYYGMRSILIVFMTQYLLTTTGEPDFMTDAEAKVYFHLFSSIIFFAGIFGAILADFFLGKYKTILYLSLVYIAGHITLSIDDTRIGLVIGLSLIAIGAGGMKPSVSAHVGDQFSRSNEHLLGITYSWFYIVINFGAFLSMITIPYILKHYGASIAFLIPGIVMLIATIIFWMGRYKFVHKPPTPINNFFTILKENRKDILKLGIVFAFVAVFWSLFDQISSSWVIQGKQLDKQIFGIEILPSQIPAASPFLNILLVPFFYYIVYPYIEKKVKFESSKKIFFGFLLTALSFIVIALIQEALEQDLTLNIAWQVLAFVILTCAEIMIVITIMEIAYKNASPKLKSIIMSMLLLSVSLGNLLTSFINFILLNDNGSMKISDSNYFWLYVIIMLITAFIYYIYVIGKGIFLQKNL